MNGKGIGLRSRKVDYKSGNDMHEEEAMRILDINGMKQKTN